MLEIMLVIIQSVAERSPNEVRAERSEAILSLPCHNLPVFTRERQTSIQKVCSLFVCSHDKKLEVQVGSVYGG